MYTPAHFAETRIEVMQQLMQSHRLATIVHHGDGGRLDANHIPLLIDPSRGRFGTLVGHVARANPLWREATSEVLVIFQGPQAYITPSWYVGKQTHGKVVPTWNYAVVHAHGRLRAIDDPDWLRNHVTTMTAANEAARTAPWQVGDAPADYIATMLQAIVGIEIEITALTGKWKVSQNRSAEDRAGVAAGLAADGETAMAAAVQSKQ